MTNAADAQQNETRPREPDRGSRLDLALVKEFVGVCHGNLDRTKQMLDEQPKLINAAWDWGGGDWETGLGGASHTGHSDIAKFLLSQGARIDSFCAAMLGERDVVRALLAANPSVATTRGPHGYTLLYHAAISGDVAIAKDLKSHIPPKATDYNQALCAAARDGRLAMTSWLLKNGVTDPNVPDVFHKTPLAIALERGFVDVAEELRRNGGRETI